MARVALVTCAQLPGLDSDTRLLADRLSAEGVSVFPLVWDDPEADWTVVDLAVVRCCWDYATRRPAFLAWAERVPRLANPANVLVWNTDKHYLLDLAAAGVPVVSTMWVTPNDRWTPPDGGDCLIKPSISLASLDTGRYRVDDAAERALAIAHVDRLRAEGRTAMVQPYLRGIDEDGETSLVFIGGAFSHAVSKEAVLEGPDSGLDRRFLPQGGLTLRRRHPSRAQLDVARRALSAVPGGAARLLYARVDLVPGPDGEPVLMELELTEPQLYFGVVPEAVTRFAAAGSALMGLNYLRAPASRLPTSAPPDFDTKVSRGSPELGHRVYLSGTAFLSPAAKSGLQPSPKQPLWEVL